MRISDWSSDVCSSDLLILLGGQPRRGRQDTGRLAGPRIGLAKDIGLIGNDAVVIGAAAPEHRRGRHQRSLGRLDDLEVAGAARLARDAIVARVDEADIFGRLLVEQRIAALRIGRSEEHTSELQSLMRISYAVF